MRRRTRLTTTCCPATLEYLAPPAPDNGVPVRSGGSERRDKCGTQYPFPTSAAPFHTRLPSCGWVGLHFAHCGFRKMSGSSDGTWCLRLRIENGKQVRGTLGTLDEFTPYERFDKAVLAERNWHTQLTSGGSASPSYSGDGPYMPLALSQSTRWAIRNI
jgi:hypothetical protein